MKNPSEYLKMRVLAAIDMAEGKTITARIRAVSEMTFEDEEGQRHRFTFRTIDEVRQHVDGASPEGVRRPGALWAGRRTNLASAL